MIDHYVNFFAPVMPKPNHYTLPSLQDVMVVGEPSLMGGEFGEEDERLITRLENSQYDPAAAAAQAAAAAAQQGPLPGIGPGGPMEDYGPPPSWVGGPPPPGPPPPTNQQPPPVKMEQLDTKKSPKNC